MAVRRALGQPVWVPAVMGPAADSASAVQQLALARVLAWARRAWSAVLVRLGYRLQAAALLAPLLATEDRGSGASANRAR